jgi:hypothetical protein
MFGHDAPVLADHDAIGVGVDFDRTPNCAGAHRVFVVVQSALTISTLWWLTWTA